MRALIDSGLWWRRYHGLPLTRRLSQFLEQEVGEFWLCPLSVQEMLYKWRHRKLPAPDPEGWLAEAIEGYRFAPVTVEAGRVAGLWEWPHGDPVDRLLAAVARMEGADAGPHRSKAPAADRFSAAILSECGNEVRMDFGQRPARAHRSRQTS